jgi:large subunit ribosomal protein L17
MKKKIFHHTACGTMASHAAKNFRRLGREHGERKSLFKSMITALFKHERIETTFPKAKAMQRYAEKMITLAKKNGPHARDRAGAYVREPQVLDKLFGEYAKRYRDRQGGYTRVMRTRRRLGDHALMAFIELVDRPGELRPARKKEEKEDDVMDVVEQ